MSWITPKNSWVSTDYYNLEDAQRIAGNIVYLKDMAVQIYGTSSIKCLVLRGSRKYNNNYVKCYGTVDIYPQSLTVKDPSLYTYATTTSLDLDSNNFETLVKLLMLSNMAEPTYVEGFNISYDNVNTYTYTGNCIHNDHYISSGYMYTKPIESIFPQYSSFYSNFPVNTAWNNYPTGKCYAGISAYVYNLINNKFYYADTLNAIEYNINTIYNRFTNYLGG